ncbi:hypothetical protein BTA51_28550 [Hahella sp. CCB-MM4]|nr:hypothetical protein BTA51_28550 [Hahella sp. CCB-MM4]
MGVNSDPITLHKYLYANADPVMYTDPTGNFSLGSVMSSLNTIGTLASRAQSAYSFFQYATGEKELTAKDAGIAILMNALPIKALGIFTKGCKNSFEEGTLVHTSGGLVSIEEVKIGDYVLSFDETSSEQEWNSVVHLIQGEKTYELVTIITSDGESVSATGEHPFYVSGEWKNANELISGDKILTKSGEVIVENTLDEIFTVKVYNLTVANAHTYYVGSSGLLAHNAGGCFKFNGKVGNGRVRAAGDADDWEIQAAMSIAGYKGKRVLVRGRKAEAKDHTRADLVFDNKVWDVKTIGKKNAGSVSAQSIGNEIQKQLKKSSGSSRIVIDVRLVPGVTHQDVVGQIMRANGSSSIKRKASEVMIIFPDKVTSWPY